MKQMLVLLTAMVLLFASLSAGSAEKIVPGPVLLLTEYRQIGWGERYQLGFLDRNGNLWSLCLNSWQGVPWNDAELIAWLGSCTDLEWMGSLSSSRLFALVGLVDTVQAQKVSYTPAANDAGTQVSMAVRQDRNGQQELVILGASGDEMYENTDPSAQALYRFLRESFPQVTSYDREPYMSPKGFQPMDIITFRGYSLPDRSGLRVVCYAIDCEEGPSEIEADRTVDDILRLKVTGKENACSVTGNTVIYSFVNRDGATVASFEFCHGLLVTSDGMYRVTDSI